MFEDEDQPSKKASLLARPRFDTWSIADLRDYIQALTAEVARAEATIQDKSAARGAADSFFKTK